MSLYVPFLQAASASTTGSFAGSLIPIVLMIVIFYFFLIRPQSKKQKETEAMINSLKKGDKVITVGGIHGVVSSVKEKTIVIKVDDNTKIEFNRTAISSVEKSEAELAKEAAEKAEKKGKKAKKTSEETVEEAKKAEAAESTEE